MFTRHVPGGGAFSDGVLRRAVSLVASASLALSLALSPVASIAPAATGTCSSSTADAATLSVLDDDADVVDWTTCGTCEWSIDSDGLLSIRPADGAETGTLESWSSYATPWHSYRSKVTAFSVEEGVIAPKSLSYMFYGCTNLVSIDFTNFDTSQTTTMSYLLSGAPSLATLELGGIDTSSVTTMKAMFSNCRALTQIDLSGLDTSSVTTMASMFEGCTGLEGIDLTGLDVSEVESMDSLLSGCTSLAEADLSSLSTESLEDMDYMFEGCTSLQTVDFSGFDTTLVKYMSYMFDGCTALEELDLTSFDTYCVTWYYAMFRNCTSLKTLDISTFDTTNASYSSYMFSNCTALRTLVVGEGFSLGSLVPAPEDDTYGTGLWADADGNLCDYTEETSTSYEYVDDVLTRVTTTTYVPELTDNKATTWTAVFDVDGVWCALSSDGDGAIIADTSEDDATELSSSSSATVQVAAVVSLASTSCTCDGTAQTPAVTVTLGGVELVEGTDFVVVYADNVSVGTATATVYGIGDYTGSVTKTFTITSSSSGSTSASSSVTAPKTTVASLKSTKKGVLIARAAKKSGVSYQFRWRAAGTKAWKTSAAAAKVTRTIKGLKSGKRYQVQVRTKKSVSGKTVWSAWSKAKSAKVR